MRTGLLRVALVLACTAACGESSAVEAPRGAPAGGPFVVPDPLTVQVTGGDFTWHLRYPGRDGVLETEDDVLAERHLHAPEGARLRLEITSTDFLYTLAFPHVGQKEVAVPDLMFPLEFAAAETGVFEMKGDQFCGYAHPDLVGTLVVESPEAFQLWLAGKEAGR